MSSKIFSASALLLIAAFNVLILSGANAEPQHSKLWGIEGERWQPDGTHTKLLDFTDVGYMKGDVPLPDWPVSVNVKDFGAVGDGEHDDTQAFIDAIEACKEETAVLIPTGRYKITKQIVIEKDSIVLRGEDMYRSVIWMPKYLTEVYTLDLNHLSKALRAAAYDENGNSYEGRPLYGVFKPNDKDGNPVKFNKSYTRLLRGQHPSISGFIRMLGGTQKGIENLSFEMREQRKGWHWENIGADPIQFDTVTDGWVRNVYVKNADHSIRFKKCRHISAINIFIDAYTLRNGGGGAGGHAGIGLSDSNHMLIHNVRMSKLYIHDIMITGGMSDSVFSRISGYDLKLDHHSQGGKHALFTEIDFGKGSRPFSSSRYESYWGLTSKRPISYDEVRGRREHKQNVVVGMTTEDPSASGDEYWHETIDPAKLEPGNLYLAQMKKKGKPLPEYSFPEKPLAPGEARDFIAIADSGVEAGSEQNTGFKHNFLVSSRGGQAYLKFDLREAGIVKVESAILRVYDGPIHRTYEPEAEPREKRPTDPRPMQVQFHSVADDTWQEHSIHGLNAPPASDFLAEATMGSGTWHEIDVTAYINKQLASDKIISLRISAKPEEKQKVFVLSSDSSHPPHLIIKPAKR